MSLVTEITLQDLLTSYQAIEALIGNRYMSDNTRLRACEALKALNEQFSQLLNQLKAQAADNAA